MRPTPDLPQEHVTQSLPFFYTGVNYFGPLLCRDIPGTGKVWVCLFTCMATQAIHLELATDMTSEQFLLVLRWFIARCGTPLEFLSNNTLQFQVATLSPFGPRLLLQILFSPVLPRSNRS